MSGEPLYLEHLGFFWDLCFVFRLDTLPRCTLCLVFSEKSKFFLLVIFYLLMRIFRVNTCIYFSLLFLVRCLHKSISNNICTKDIQLSWILYVLIWHNHYQFLSLKKWCGFLLLLLSHTVRIIRIPINHVQLIINLYDSRILNVNFFLNSASSF